jgi:glycine/D-amino acid oxidase-like deaminating enzyme/nitrite reductase/ring-hydroxylating ferredoxin subunit
VPGDGSGGTDGSRASDTSGASGRSGVSDRSRANDGGQADDRPSLPGEVGPVWLASNDSTDYPALEDDDVADTVVVGGGVAGITTAAALASAGDDVVLLEADRIVRGVTGHTTAKLTSQHGLIYEHVRSTFGEREARLYGEANEAAIDHLEARIDELPNDCEFERTPAYTYVRDDDRAATVRREAETAADLGLPARFTGSTPLVGDVAGAIRFDDQARFDPRAYLLAEAERVVEQGGRIYETARATDLRTGTGIEVETERGLVTADRAVVATHFPFHDHGLYFARMRPKKGYVLSVRLEEPAPEGLYYRASDPYFSVRPHPAGESSHALVGGQNHRTGHGGDGVERYRALEREAREHLDVAAVERRWSTQDFVSVDRVPFVGQLAPQTEDVYVATGFGGWGLSNGVAAGLLLSDLVHGVENEWSEVYSPTRLALGASTRDLLEQGWHTAHNVASERLAPQFGEDEPNLSPGEGTVVHDGSGATGHYRDEDGEHHAVSVICPHMGCVLDWNDADRTWACPCHGSRFERDGSVIDGPANADLEEP